MQPPTTNRPYDCKICRGQHKTCRACGPVPCRQPLVHGNGTTDEAGNCLNCFGSCQKPILHHGGCQKPDSKGDCLGCYEQEVICEIDGKAVHGNYGGDGKTVDIGNGKRLLLPGCRPSILATTTTTTSSTTTSSTMTISSSSSRSSSSSAVADDTRTMDSIYCRSCHQQRELDRKVKKPQRHQPHKARKRKVPTDDLIEDARAMKKPFITFKDAHGQQVEYVFCALA